MMSRNYTESRAAVSAGEGGLPTLQEGWKPSLLQDLGSKATALQTIIIRVYVRIASAVTSRYNSLAREIGLDELPVGGSSRIASILGDGRRARELLTLGLVPGAPVRVLRRALGGDPIEISAGGHPICLRVAQSRRVRVTAVSGAS